MQEEGTLTTRPYRGQPKLTNAHFYLHPLRHSNRGGPHKFKNRWTTFLKARLNCSVPGEYPFYFDEIQSSSELVTGLYQLPPVGAAYTPPELFGGGGARPNPFQSLAPSQLLYAVFTTNANAPSASAVCAFSVGQIERVFAESAFKAQLNDDTNANWLPVPPSRLPQPRPGQCACSGGATAGCANHTLSDKSLHFIKETPLLDESVFAEYGGPLLISTEPHYRYTKIAVHAQLPLLQPAGRPVDVMFVGTSDGQVLKALTLTGGGGGNGSPWSQLRPLLIERIPVFANGQPVTDLKMDAASGRLLVLSAKQLVSIPLQRCERLASSCAGCVRLQDPYCAWDPQLQLCAAVSIKT